MWYLRFGEFLSVSVHFSCWCLLAKFRVELFDASGTTTHTTEGTPYANKLKIANLKAYQNYQNMYQIFYSQFAIEYYSVTRRYSSVLAGHGNRDKHKYYFSFSNSKSPKNKEHWDLQLHPDGSPRMDTLKLLSCRKLFNLLFFTNSVIWNAYHRRKISAFTHLLLK